MIHLLPGNIIPGMKTYCQLVLNEPIHAVWKDRFIIRSANAEDTIGGGTVIHPRAAPHHRDASIYLPWSFYPVHNAMSY